MLRSGVLVSAILLATTWQLLTAAPAQDDTMNTMNDETKTVIEECAKEHKVNTTEIFKPKYDPTTEPNFPCFFKCCFLTLKYIDENGNTNMTRYKEKFDITEEQEKKEKECSAFKDDDLCIQVVVTQSCFINNLGLQ